MFDNASLHFCIQHDLFIEKRGILTFIPPDGRFELMKYKVEIEPKMIPFKIKPSFDLYKQGIYLYLIVGDAFCGKCEISVNTFTSSLHHDKTFDSFIITVKLPTNVKFARPTATRGNAVYISQTNTISWDLGKLACVNDTIKGIPLLTSSFDLDGLNIRKNIIVNAEFSMFTSCSGVSLESVTVTGEKYVPFKGGKCLMRSGKFSVRC